ncbi:SpoIIE family protein phosphatase [Streptomyces griseus]|uniref:fused response regulator/phosphatase n=1 Tax=Streptomyces TaxID=1883 RepID=UPI0004CA3163|nr:fused response regulator/phosphatase [Streptomyces griseus]MYR11910.1 SpoIIE family protein phosphatase [Streptomyces sp. SID724]NEB52616.1 SpoIIE family protein phosphatase [Streptomyces griseus]
MTKIAQRDSAPGTVLVIDDDETNRYILTSWLVRAGHTVLGAADGAEGLALLERADHSLPEAAVIDVQLPDMTGFEVCERIKADPRTAHLPVVHVSAVAVNTEDHTEGLSRGADAYLDQPIDPNEFLATVTAALRYARARLRAERLTLRLAALNRATLDVYRAVGFPSFSAAATGGAASLMSGPATAVLLSPQGLPVHSHAAGPDAPPVSRPARPELLDQLASSALGSGTGAEVVVLPADRWKALLPLDPIEGDVVLVVARTKRNRPPVCVAVPAAAARTTDERELLQQLVNASALALEALRTYNEEHALALALQRTFLPDRLPDAPGTALAVRYLPASDHAEIGGDFYEALQTPAGLLLAIGDVAGHSLVAATVMGEIRHALRAYALEDHPPHHVLERLDALLAHTRPGLTVTLCLVLVEPGGGRLHIANAGHIPPLLLRPDGSAAYLPEHGPLLGLRLSHPPAHVHPAEPGSRLVLITDGLVEVRNRDLDDSLAEFLDAAASGPRELEALCDFLLRSFGEDKEDDIALLALHLGPDPDPA